MPRKLQKAVTERPIFRRTLLVTLSVCSSDQLHLLTRFFKLFSDIPCARHRCWCPDRTLAQARKFIAESMGPQYAEGVILDLEKTWQESDRVTPLICFLSMGSDPTNNIESLSKKLKLECVAISMGQGQEIHARRLLQQCFTGVGSPLQSASIGSCSRRLGSSVFTVR